ncbi:Aldehyde reductase 2-like protein 4 [Colletotrichum chlorophyti]|uniref:Aldehyde reductase 2-like protein 4 n=1 Tax=Colletotrichum chlorophyti TaxID=708187 RepID=A0A1Q8RTA0_9PEZI|nr:Aldehyde reductase 2-like protein 4 [Colletotrichum chlorophyti]
METPNKFAIPKGSTVLIVGANGFIASHIVNQFLHFGFKVRGTVRDPSKNAWLSALFDKKYGIGNFELIAAPNLMLEGALNEAVKGTSAVVHVASLVSFDPDPNKVIPPALKLVTNALQSAYREPSVKRFVLTSSSTTTIPCKMEGNLEGRVITSDTWSEDAVDLAMAPPPYTADRSAAVYAASKIMQERRLWSFFEEEKDKRPDMVVNTVLPAMSFGRSLDPINQGHASSSRIIENLWRGLPIPAPFLPPRMFSDVEDVAVLHVAATILPSVNGERICCFAETFNWNRVLAILRKQNPDHKFPEDFEGNECRHQILTRQRAEEVLKIMGRKGLTSLEESIRLNTEDLCQTA